MRRCIIKVGATPILIAELGCIVIWRCLRGQNGATMRMEERGYGPK